MLEGDSSLLAHVEAVNPVTRETVFPVEVKVELSLNGYADPLLLPSRLVYKRRLSQTRFQFGFVIYDLLPDDRQRLLVYLSERSPS